MVLIGILRAPVKVIKTSTIMKLKIKNLKRADREKDLKVSLTLGLLVVRFLVVVAAFFWIYFLN
jgi:hypothetical protein